MPKLFNIFPSSYHLFIPFNYVTKKRSSEENNCKFFINYHNLKEQILKNNGIINEIDINELDENNRIIKTTNEIKVIINLM